MCIFHAFIGGPAKENCKGEIGCLSALLKRFGLWLSENDGHFEAAQRYGDT